MQNKYIMRPALLSQHIRLCAFLLCSSTVGVHFYYVQAHSAAHSAHSAARFCVEMHAHSAGTRQGSVRIPTAFQHCLRAFQLRCSTMFQYLSMCTSLLYSSTCLRTPLLCSSNFWVYSSISPVRIPAVLQHCLRAFLLCSSTSCGHYYYATALFSVRIPTVLQHCLRAFLLCSSIFLHAFLFSRVRVHAIFRHYLTRKTIQKYLVFPLQFHYISIIVPSHFHCISCISFPAFLFHCISFQALLVSSYLAS